MAMAPQLVATSLPGRMCTSLVGEWHQAGLVQRFAYLAGGALILAGLAHLAAWLVVGGAWQGPVSPRVHDQQGQRPWSAPVRGFGRGLCRVLIGGAGGTLTVWPVGFFCRAGLACLHTCEILASCGPPSGTWWGSRDAAAGGAQTVQGPWCQPGGAPSTRHV
jgi:hypothetical protein